MIVNRRRFLLHQTQSLTSYLQGRSTSKLKLFLTEKQLARYFGLRGPAVPTFSMQSIKQGAHCNNPSSAHVEAVKRIRRYLKGTKTVGLKMNKAESLTLEAYSDSDFAGEPEMNDHPMRSLGGQVNFLEGIGLIHAESSLQSCIARSTGEAEYMGSGKTAQFCSGFRQLLAEIGFPQSEPTTIFADNQAAIAMVKSKVSGATTRHIKLHHHYIRELAEAKEIKLEYCPTEQMIADIMTKALPTVQFELLRDKLLYNL